MIEDQKRKDAIANAQILQRICEDEYLAARMAYQRGYLNITTYHQREAAKTFVLMQLQMVQCG